MKNLTFSKDEGTQFYTELHRRVNSYFAEQGIAKTNAAIKKVDVNSKLNIAKNLGQKLKEFLTTLNKWRYNR